MAGHWTSTTLTIKLTIPRGKASGLVVSRKCSPWGNPSYTQVTIATCTDTHTYALKRGWINHSLAHAWNDAGIVSIQPCWLWGFIRSLAWPHPGLFLSWQCKLPKKCEKVAFTPIDCSFKYFSVRLTTDWYMDVQSELQFSPNCRERCTTNHR